MGRHGCGTRHGMPKLIFAQHGFEASERRAYAQIYPVQTVDGVVHALGGKELALACERVAEVQPGVRCKTGSAVCTPPAGQRLGQLYQKIVHTVPPFYKQYAQAEAEELLLRCYLAAFQQVWAPWRAAHSGRIRLEGWWAARPKAHGEAASSPWACATPLLGAGTRGVPLDAALRIAASAAALWVHKGGNSRDPSARAALSAEPVDQFPSETGGVLLFGIPQQDVTEKLATALDRALQCATQGAKEVEPEGDA